MSRQLLVKEHHERGCPLNQQRKPLTRPALCLPACLCSHRVVGGLSQGAHRLTGGLRRHERPAVAVDSACYQTHTHWATDCRLAAVQLQTDLVQTADWPRYRLQTEPVQTAD